MRAEATANVTRAVHEMESIERPPPDILFEPVYASGQPWTLVEQSRERVGD
jgi:hypothetical protein